MERIVGRHGRRNGALALLAALALLLAGCGAGHEADQASSGSPSEKQTTGTETVVASAEQGAPESHPSTTVSPTAPSPTGTVHVVQLSDDGCIRFEPQWTKVRVGQSITWKSDLEKPIRIYVSPGVFARNEFVVRPGATLHTGAARSSGRFSFWTEPTACQDMPLGVLLSGPGVMVEETFYASAPGIH